MNGWALAVLLGCLVSATACTPENTPSDSFTVANQGLLCAAYSPDGEHLFTGSFQHGGALWQQVSGERLYNWNLKAGEYSAFSSADFSEDGNFVAVSNGETVTIWNVASGEVVTHLQSPAQSLAIENATEIWATENGNEYWSKPGRVLDLALSKQYLLLGLENQVSLLIDTASRSVIGALPHQDVITAVAMDEMARFAITGSRDGEAIVWSLDSGKMQSTYQTASAITFVDIAATGEVAIVASYQGPVELISTSTSEPIATLFKTNPGITAARFDRVRKRLLIGTAREQIMLFDLGSNTLLQNWQIPFDGPWHKAAIVDLAFGVNGPVAVASNGQAYRLSEK